jgi:threonine/homoserine/homoserine lactone efflux protein
MLESIITIFIVGLIAGMIYSVPIAGPISIIIVSKALEGKLRFCQRTAIGAAVVEFIYVFIVVYGIAALYSYYQPFIPYLLLIGAILVLLISIKIIRKQIDLKSFDATEIITDKIENRGGMRTGIFINLTNPSLFISWLVASFITLSFVSSLGFNTGGLDILLNENVNSVSEITGTEFEDIEELNNHLEDANTEPGTNSLPVIILSLVFAFSVGLGALIWLDQLARLIIRHREKIKVSLLNKLIQILGVVLFFLGLYLAYQAVVIFIGS